MFRTAEYSPTGEDLRTGIPAAEYDVAFEVDSIDQAAREGWSVLIHGPAHHMDTLTEHDLAMKTGVEPWAGGEREHAIRITPRRISGPADPQVGMTRRLSRTWSPRGSGTRHSSSVPPPSAGPTRSVPPSSAGPVGEVAEPAAPAGGPASRCRCPGR